MDVKIIVSAILLVLMLGTAIVYFAGQLRQQYGADIRVIFFFYSLTLVVTSVIGIWAVCADIIDEKGNFLGDIGGVLLRLVGATLDIEASLYIIAVISIVLLLPQVISYFLSGLFGVATSVLFFSESYSFAVWWVVKTFIVAAGVTTVVPIFALYFSWENFTYVESSFMLSLCLISYSFILLGLYRKGEHLAQRIFTRLPSWTVRIIRSIHAWCSRAETRRN
ncbi:hypothetical protein V3H24_23415 [Vibrio parahaemolyticus]|uniref:hypothetical protein n=1 Tax=Vibrio parahaemolyticus TaxID=670 RepID=UPI00112458E6|nr:hypothetical protein [Vibrio parahaemolyticus]TPA20929.1 hypothetical protein DXJ84_24735 [Vibrio parahaemolyticus]